MVQKVSSNEKISFAFSKANAIDIEALNIVAGQSEQIFCGCTYSEANGKHHLEYNVCLANNLYLLKDSFVLEVFLQQCLQLYEVIKKYGMNLTNVQDNVQHMYRTERGYGFIYIPIVTKKSINYKKFIIKVLAQLKNKDTRVSGIIKTVKKLKTDDEICAYLGTYTIPYTQNAVDPNVSSDSEGETTFLSQPEPEGETTLLSQPEPEGETTLLSQPEPEGETTLLSQPEPEGETTFLEPQTTAFLPNESAECETTFLANDVVVRREQPNTAGGFDLYLLRVGTGEQIHINKTGYSIGKDIHNMDYVLGNASVSRNHASIYIEDDKFYLTDNGSTNGTTIEGIRVQMGERAELSDGDIVSLGNEVFQVLLERKGL